MFDSKKVKSAMAAIVSLFCVVCVVFSYFSFYHTGIIKELNPEADAAKEEIEIMASKNATVEGIFIDRNGLEITSYSEPGEAALLNYNECFSYLIGYNSTRMNVSGLRKSLFTDLFDGGKDNIGATVELTIDADIQEELYELLEGMMGSISVVNADTGEIVALVSRSDPEVGYNVAIVDEIYEQEGNKIVYYSDFYNSIDNFNYNMAVFAQDPPGSTAKVMTLVSLLENGKGDLEYFDTGSILNGKITNYAEKKYGNCDLKTAINESINTYFANAGLTLGRSRLKRTFERFMVGKTIELDFTTLKSTFADGSLSDFDVASNAFGQGELVMSPLHVAMMMSAVINEDGNMMKPYLISSITNDKKTQYKGGSEILSEVMEPEIAEEARELLNSNAHVYGLYKNFDEDDIYIIAKTGTAEVEIDNEMLNHIYYAIGAEINGTNYGICIDQKYVESTGSALKGHAIEVLEILSEYC